MLVPHDQILTHIPRREIMQNQISMSYRVYCSWFLEETNVARNDFIDRHFQGRSNHYYEQTKVFDKVIKWLEDELTNFSSIDNVEIKKEEQ